MKRPEPVRVGDTFTHDGTTWEVIMKYPGGKMDLFSKAKSSFVSCYQRQFRQWAWPRCQKNSCNEHCPETTREREHTMRPTIDLGWAVGRLNGMNLEFFTPSEGHDGGILPAQYISISDAGKVLRFLQDHLPVMHTDHGQKAGIPQ